ncbi:hypothetical protein [Stieleria mannarensis]|uniref:hypothetical protein n=1 Tax=Stieleria mannarensis TaxID=2755585 RepID=UPI0016048664|nr:hypothetical protein [Rhodopirellula sp. JC639]
MTPRFSLRQLMFALTIAVFGVWSISIGLSRARHNADASQSTYAARLVAQMCVRHMSFNGDSWPKGWQELRDDFAPCMARTRQSWDFDDLKERVGVDWNLDPADLLTVPDSATVIWVASDPDFPFHGTTPNAIVLRHLHDRNRLQNVGTVKMDAF